MGATAHINFIAASYAAAVIIIGALIAWIALDYRVTRRSASSRTDRTIEQVKAAADAQAKEQA
jgi:hypothetical protein